MSKKTFFSLFSSLLVLSMSTTYFVINNNIFDSNNNQNLKNIDSISQKNDANNTSKNELRSISSTAYSDTSAANGYFIYDENTSEIKYISFFGNLAWTYDVANSEFIKKNIGTVNSNQITYLQMKFNSTRNRIVVYGIANNISFLFQLNTDGTEYFLNLSQEDDVKYTNSFLSSKNNNGMVNNVLQLSILNDLTAISLPSDTINDTNTIDTYRVDLDSYKFTAITINLNNYVPWNSTTNTGSNTLDNSYKAHQFIAIQNFTDDFYVLFFSVKSTTNTDKVYFSALRLDLNFTWQPVTNIKVNCWPIGTNNNPTEYPDVFNLKSTKTAEGKYLSILTYQISPLEVDVKTGYKTYFVTYYNNRVRIIDETNYISSEMTGLQNNNVCAYDIIFNPYTNDFIVTTWAKTSDNLYIFFLTLVNKTANDSGGGYYTSNETIHFTMENDFLVTNAAYYVCIFTPILDSTITSIWNMSYLFSVYTYDNSKNLINSDKTKIWSTIVNNKNVTVQAFTLTEMTNAQEAVNGYEPFRTVLPQDVTADQLNELIYLHNSLNTNRIYESYLSFDDNNPLSYDNNVGTLSGTVKLRLTKWWISNSKQYVTYLINLNLSNFATITSLSFQLVVSNGVDSSKWNNILNLQSTKFPSEITKKDILDNFILTGSAIKITEDNISLGSETVINPLITVTANDDTGNLTISYNLDSISSPSMLASNLSGEYVFTDFKSGQAYEQIFLNSIAYTKIMATKLPFQVTKDDILNCLTLSSGYSRNSSDWQWTPLHSEGTQDFINDQITGTLYGEIKYLKTSDFGNTSIPESTYTLILDNTNSTGFIDIIDYLSNSVTFNQKTADGLAGGMSQEQVTNNYFNIIKQATTINNNWFNIDDLKYVIDESQSDNNKLVVNMEKPTSLNVIINGSSLTFDSNWINTLLSKVDTIFGQQQILFNYGYINYSWNYHISNSNSGYSIKELLSQSSSEVKNEFKNVEYILPSEFINNFYDEQSGNFNKFQDVFNLLNVSNVTDISSIYYFEIKSVQLIAYNSDGTLTANYIINYPNVGSALNGGTNVYPTIKITGFKKDVYNTVAWLIPLITTLILLMLIIAIIILVRKSKKDKFLYSKNPKMKKISIKYNKKIKKY